MTKKTDLLLVLAEANLIAVPTGVTQRTLSFLRQHNLLDKHTLMEALNTGALIKMPGAGVTTAREACWYLVYGNDRAARENYGGTCANLPKQIRLSQQLSDVTSEAIMGD